MDPVYFAKMDGKPIIGDVEKEEAVLKVNELIAWTKKHEKEHIKQQVTRDRIMSLLRQIVNRIPELKEKEDEE